MKTHYNRYDKKGNEISYDKFVAMRQADLDGIKEAMGTINYQELRKEFHDFYGYWPQ